MALEQVIERQNKNGRTGTGKKSGERSGTIPRPLVQANRTFLVVTITLALLLNKTLLVLPLLLGAISVTFRWNPVIALGRSFLRNAPGKYRREDPSDQLFNQWLATLMLGLSGLAFLAGNPVLGYLFSGMVILAATVALLGFCVGCYIRFQLNQWKHRRA